MEYGCIAHDFAFIPIRSPDPESTDSDLSPVYEHPRWCFQTSSIFTPTKYLPVKNKEPWQLFLNIFSRFCIFQANLFSHTRWYQDFLVRGDVPFRVYIEKISCEKLSTHAVTCAVLPRWLWTLQGSPIRIMADHVMDKSCPGRLYKRKFSSLLAHPGWWNTEYDTQYSSSWLKTIMMICCFSEFYLWF